MRQVAGISGLALLAILAGVSVLPGQAPLDSGRTVRVTTIAERTSGVLLAPYSRSSIALRFCSGSSESCAARTVPSRDLLHLEILTGTHAKSGAIIGGVAGAVVGGFLGLMVAGVCDSANCASLQRGVVVGMLVGGLPTAAVGGVIGSLIPKWGPAP
jgi:hypothetical protein